MIEKILQSDDISAQTSIILINVLFFMGRWETTFNFRFKNIFHSTETASRELEFMKVGSIERLYFNEGDEWESVGIPYLERKYWMFVVLPKKKHNLENLIKTLNYSTFMEFTKGYVYHRVRPNEKSVPVLELIAVEWMSRCLYLKFLDLSI